MRTAFTTVVAIAMACCIPSARSQAAPPPQPPAPAATVITPAHAEGIAYLKLQLTIEKVRNQGAQIQSISQSAQAQIGPLQQQAQQLMIEAGKLAADVKKEEKWGDDVRWNDQTGQFERTAQPKK